MGSVLAHLSSYLWSSPGPVSQGFSLQARASWEIIFGWIRDRKGKTSRFNRRFLREFEFKAFNGSWMQSRSFGILGYFFIGIGYCKDSAEAEVCQEQLPSIFIVKIRCAGDGSVALGSLILVFCPFVYDVSFFRPSSPVLPGFFVNKRPPHEWNGLDPWTTCQNMSSIFENRSILSLMHVSKFRM